ncbi:MAG: hypothetical protein ACE5EJ_06905 [Nitrosopumilaceae archaeon]
MTDAIAGFVDGVLNRDSFDLNVTQIDPKNEVKYKTTERIKMSNIPEQMNKMADDDAKKALAMGLVGKEVICEVKSRDSEGTLECDVFYKK